MIWIVTLHQPNRDCISCNDIVGSILINIGDHQPNHYRCIPWHLKAIVSALPLEAAVLTAAIVAAAVDDTCRCGKSLKVTFVCL